MYHVTVILYSHWQLDIKRPQFGDTLLPRPTIQMKRHHKSSVLFVRSVSRTVFDARYIFLEATIIGQNITFRVFNLFYIHRLRNRFPDLLYMSDAFEGEINAGRR